MRGWNAGFLPIQKNICKILFPSCRVKLEIRLDSIVVLSSRTDTLMWNFNFHLLEPWNLKRPCHKGGSDPRFQGTEVLSPKSQLKVTARCVVLQRFQLKRPIGWSNVWPTKAFLGWGLDAPEHYVAFVNCKEHDYTSNLKVPIYHQLLFPLKPLASLDSIFRITHHNAQAQMPHS